MQVQHVPGRENVVADILSRRCDYALNALSSSTAEVRLKDMVRSAAPHDPEYQSLWKAAADGKRPEYVVIDELLYHRLRKPREPEVHRLYIPSGELRAQLLREAHDVPISGHLGRDKTLDKLQRSMFWPKMAATVQEYVRTCPQCQKNKPNNTKLLMDDQTNLSAFYTHYHFPTGHGNR
jgi:hypothetical protein